MTRLITEIRLLLVTLVAIIQVGAGRYLARMLGWGGRAPWSVPGGPVGPCDECARKRRAE